MRHTLDGGLSPAQGSAVSCLDVEVSLLPVFAIFLQHTNYKAASCHPEMLHLSQTLKSFRILAWKLFQQEKRALKGWWMQSDKHIQKHRLWDGGVRLMLFGAAWGKTNKCTNTFLFPDSKHQPSWLRCVCDSALWKGIMLMLWPLDVDVFAWLNRPFLLCSLLHSGTQSPRILIKGKAAKRKGVGGIPALCHLLSN